MIAEAVMVAEKAAAAKGFWDRLSPTLKKPIVNSVKRIFINFEQYLGDTYEKNRYVSLLCSRTTPSLLCDIYVDTFFRCKNSDEDQISDLALVSDVRDNKRVIIRGNGGSGKTFFLKKLWNDIFAEPEGRIPVFVELRKLNGLDTINIEALIRHSLSSKEELSTSLFRDIAKAGSFIFIFDGFDEVALDKREALEAQLLKLEVDFRDCGFVVSSRPNEAFRGWARFFLYDVKPFNREQVLDLVGKAPIEKPTKMAFSTKLTPEFFKKHNDFLSSPLLALMMLITFRSKADIPDSLNEFYEHAFQALFCEHDATKESFKREHFLSITEFKRVFACFCMFTYYENCFEFKETRFLEYIEKAKKFVNTNANVASNINCSTTDIMHEFVESVNLIQKDGMDYLFIHRSFQEYFAAYFAIHIATKKKSQLLELFAGRAQDSTLSIAYEMNALVVEEDYVLNMCDRFFEKGTLHRVIKQKQRKYEYIKSNNFSFRWHDGLYYRKPPKGVNINSNLALRIIDGPMTRFYFVLDRLIFNYSLMDVVRASAVNIGDHISFDIKGAEKSQKLGDKLSVVLRVDYDAYKFLIVSDDGAEWEISDPDSPISISINAIDTIEEQLIELNSDLKVVNRKVIKLVKDIQSSHAEREKSIDEMFF